MPRQTSTVLAHRWRISPKTELSGPWYLRIDRDIGTGLLSQEWHLLRTGAHSMLFYAHSTKSWIIKLIKPRSTPRDQLRKYCQAQARREYIGGQYLNQLGLTVPAYHGWGVALSPFSRFESALFMESLDHFISGLSVIRSEQRIEKRRQFLELIAQGIAAIYGNNYIHKDCHFDNVCWLDDGRIAWIDNDIRKARNSEALTLGFNKTLALLYKTAGSHIEAEEWHFFTQNIKNFLNKHPNGGPLCREIQ